eukprot:SAG31_NODE_5331_length_2604_cov_1.514571_5_plen_45_part_00
MSVPRDLLGREARPALRAERRGARHLQSARELSGYGRVQLNFNL